MNLRKLILSIIVMASVLSADASVRTWESAERFPVSVEQVAQPDDISVAVYEGYVYVFVRQQTHVKLFTLLGQVIVQDTLAPGVYRYKLTSRGIYLLKAGTSTRRITL
ncbi:MAG: hypothetical protein K2O88_02035 [Paramuribaculum sp.]|nr:hypothetical protein [Paramuribaculum sp.]